MTVPTYFRRLRSLLLKTAKRFASCRRVAFIRVMNEEAYIPWSTMVERGVEIRITDGGELRVGANCSLEAGVRIVVQKATVTVGAQTQIGRGSTIVSRESVQIGTGVLIAEYVTIRDQNHVVDCNGPIISSGFDVSAIEIGNDVWIGAKASILPGCRLGSGSVIGAHALVRTSIAERAIAVGVPARVLRLRERSNE